MLIWPCTCNSLVIAYLTYSTAIRRYVLGAGACSLHSAERGSVGPIACTSALENREFSVVNLSVGNGLPPALQLGLFPKSWTYRFYGHFKIYFYVRVGALLNSCLEFTLNECLNVWTEGINEFYIGLLPRSVYIYRHSIVRSPDLYRAYIDWVRCTLCELIAI